MVSQLRRRTRAALLRPGVAVALPIRTQDVNSDETPWREGPRRAYLWGVVAAAASPFPSAYGRTRRVAAKLLGRGYTGVATWARLKS